LIVDDYEFVVPGRRVTRRQVNQQGTAQTHTILHHQLIVLEAGLGAGQGDEECSWGALLEAGHG
jgi:hypothetical protein